MGDLMGEAAGISKTKKRSRKMPPAASGQPEIQNSQTEIQEQPAVPLSQITPMAQGVYDPLPDYEHRHEKNRSAEWLKVHLTDVRFIAVISILLVVLLVWVAGLPIYRKVKSWRAITLMEQSQSMADEGNVPQALDLMRQAITMAPTNETIFRLARLLNAGLGDTQAIALLQHRMLSGEADPDELIVLAEQSLRGGQTSLVSVALEKLAEHSSGRKIILEMQLMDAAGNTKGAIELGRSKMSGISEQERVDVLLAGAEILLLKDVSASQAILEPLMASRNVAGIDALRLLAKQHLRLAGQGRIDPAQTIKALSTHPMATVSDKLLEADLRISMEPSSKKQVIEVLKAAFSSPKLKGDLEFARWLNRRQAHDEAINFIGLERALANPEWLLIYLDAHAALDRWGDVFTALDAETVVGLSDSVRLLFLARAAEKTGDIEGADAAWREMQRDLVYEKPEVVSFIASYAVQIGNAEQAFKAFSTMSKQRETSLQGFLGMIRTLPADKPTTELIKVYQDFVAAYPALGEARVDLAYLQLLTSSDMESAAAIALEMYRKDPMSLATLSAAALGCLKNGFPEEGEKLYSGKKIEWNEAPNPWKSVRVAVLRATGKSAEAEELAATIDLNALRPEERELLKSNQTNDSGPLNP